jgi:hypothetical protein
MTSLMKGEKTKIAQLYSPEQGGPPLNHGRNLSSKANGVQVLEKVKHTLDCLFRHLPLYASGGASTAPGKEEKGGCKAMSAEIVLLAHA